MCELSQGTFTFPRRPIQYVILGLKELVRRSLEPWLCHDCGDCSTTCPREAEPQESMKTLRRYLVGEYDWTGIARLMNRSKVWYAGLMGAVGLIVLFLIYFYHSRWAGMTLKDMLTTPMGLEHMFNKIIYYTLIVVLLPFFILFTNLFRMWWLTMKEERIPLIFYLKQFPHLLSHMFTHKNISRCPQPVHKKRRITHWLLAFGCVIMLVLITFFLKWFQTDKIYPVYHPQRWLGYFATIGMLVGTIDIFVGRIRKKYDLYKFTDFRDITFPVFLFLTAVSGILVHIFRYAGLQMATHYAYALHIVITTPMLLLEVPFGRWTHMLYRPFAIYFERVKESYQNLRGEELAKAA